MNNIYRFSPINTKDELREAIFYVTQKTTELCKKVTGNEYPISSLTIFTHYPDEYEKLKSIIFELGILDHENNGPFIKLHQPITLSKSKLELLRIRQPDPYRLHVGCDDFKVENYENFKNQFLKKSPNNLRLIKRPGYEMIEFFHPDYDVLAYVLSI